MRPEVEKRILDAVRACELIESFTAGVDFQKFTESALLKICSGAPV